jgi:DNA-binding NarL/FixJ family response regulator
LDELIAEGKAALRRGDGEAASAIFAPLAATKPTGEVLEGLARSAYLAHDYAAAIETWERAYAAHRDEGDGASSARTARTLAYMYGTHVGDAAVMQGWHARATTLLGGAETTPEHGWVTLQSGLFEGDRAVREQHFRDAVALGQRFGDDELRFAALAYLGASLVHDNRIEEGMLLLDEACAAVAGRDVDDFCVLEEIFCQLFSACEHAHDVTRADQWSRIAEQIAERRNLPAVSAFCRTHYGGVLTAAGRWDEADATLTEAVRLWGLGHGMLRAGALIRLADLRERQGRLEEAEQLLTGYEDWPEAARTVGALHFARGAHDRAVEVVERALGEMDGTDVGAGPLWLLLVDVHLDRGSLEHAADALEHLDAIAVKHPGAYQRAAAALARGRVCLTSGAGDPRTCLREALSGFTRAQMPMELALARLDLAAALQSESPDAAMAEARAAFESLERLQAARYADAAAAVLRKLGGQARTGSRSDTALTRREAEVLQLLGLGLSNPEISDRLYISRKTVEHHVGRILSKLGLRSRAEAAAHATRSGSSADR